MGRGQYDRAAARAKRERPIDPVTGFDPNTARLSAQPQYARPGFPYENIVTPILNPHGQPITQADYDALVAKSDRLLRLCQTHGLMI